VFIAISVSLEQFSGVAPRDHVTSSPVLQSRIFDAHCIYFFLEVSQLSCQLTISIKT